MAQEMKCNFISTDPVNKNLSSSEAKNLEFLREEEFLAGDVYKFFYQKYQIPVFSNISKSENVHTSRIKLLMNNYAVMDPLENHQTGKFKINEIQSLYDDLTKKGDNSLADALLAGALIEEKDIFDLNKAIRDVVDHEDIVFVYSNLKRASGNHLRSFIMHLNSRRVAYSPTFLTLEEFNSILAKKQE